MLIYQTCDGIYPKILSAAPFACKIKKAKGEIQCEHAGT
ncbi:hypothetical protein B4168_0895 [Anoxybacillus flavithermus]|nr:hypothetical protein B4168_0895 [Anoxybacillus flavithermus]OAO86902.1 hypothetical protein GT23_1920 [Parageobacillus thermoglucosidasius]